MAVTCPRKAIEDEEEQSGTLYLMSDPVPSNMEERCHVPLTYADLKRWLRLLVLLILAACLAWVLQQILLLFAIVILLAMVLNPIIASLESGKYCSCLSNQLFTSLVASSGRSLLRCYLYLF
jgi:hypothetical protein